LRRTTPRFTALAAAFALTLGMVMPGAANDVVEIAPVHQPPVAADQATNELADTWFIELASPPAIDGTPRGQLQREQDAFRAEAERQGLRFTERFAYQTLFNGLSITLASGSLATLQRTPGVKAIWPVVTMELDPIEHVSPELATALAMTGADIAQSELGYTGAGVKVAVMDTGIDYHHPDLGGCFGAGCRVVTGWDFVGDDFNANPSDPAYNPDPSPDPDPDDCNGHGTHVAGIVGANGDVTGVAPDITFGAYRVFGCDGSTTADIMAAAMELSHAHGMHVLNMSIGSAFQWPQYPTAVAADKLVDAGMVVVASIGNSGANGLYSVGAPGVGKNVIGVASFDNSHVSALTFTVNPDGPQVAYLPLATTPDPPTSGTSPEVVWLGRGCVNTEGDTHLANPSGKVALIIRGTCTFNEKYSGAVDAGAVGVVIYNNVTGLFAGGGVTPIGDAFGIGISNADGVAIRSLLDAGETVTLTWTDERVNAVNPTGGLISSFSSYGLPADLSFKPNIGAPGGLIRSTYPLELGGYAIISGTSMSSPHVAGAAALYLEAHPSATAGDIKVAMQNSADPKNWSLAPAANFLDHTFRQGAGMLDIDDAILATSRVTPSEIAMGEGEAGAKTHALTIRNDGSDAVTYDLSHAPALGTHGNTYAPSFNLAFGSVAFDVPTVTVPGGASAVVNATITPPNVASGILYGGYLVMTGNDGSVLRVPYAGFDGDYQSITAMPSVEVPESPALPDGGTLPGLARLTACDRDLEGSCTMGGVWELVGAGETFTLDSELDKPQFLIHLDHQVRELRLDVFDASTGRNWGRIATFDYVGRNSTPTAFFAFAFDGQTQTGRTGRNFAVPDGTYEVRVTVLKALGDPANPAHWETWTSQRFVIDRP
jgi:minor extracellular serine protease Vpr